jgi:23S rRNA pseudouridine1911/1915/1917 synthase
MRERPASETLLLEFLETLLPDSSRTSLRQMLQHGRVRVNGEIEKKAGRSIGPSDTVDIGRRSIVAAIDPRVSILFEDDHIIVILKTAGLLTVSTKREREQTAQVILNDYLSSKREERVHVVHRLDRDTSGVMLFAKSFDIREQLKETFASHDIERVYYAIVEGSLPRPSGTIRSHLHEDERTFDVRSVRDPSRGKLAVTHYRTLERAGPYSLLEVRLETGRKNQVRVHMFESGAPVIGDTRYGKPSDPLGRLGLHAAVLGLEHPTTGKTLRFTAPLPDSFRTIFPTAPNLG